MENNMKKFIVAAVLILFILASETHVFASRALTVVSDLDHKKGKIGTYYALIIGIQNYIDPGIPDLETPLKDAVDMADILKRKYGFKVELLLDSMATRRGIDSALRKIVSKAKSEDSVLIYYAGHGELDRQYNDGWWIPVDAKAGISVTYMDNVLIQKAMRNIKARHVLLISDSCYSGTLFGQGRAMPSLITEKYYLNLYNEKSRWGMTSGNKTPVSDAGTGGHSIFAYQLIKKLKNNNKSFLSTQEVYIAIAPVIANNSEQNPLCRPIKGTGDQGGEFVFISTAKRKASQPKPSDNADNSLTAGRKKIEQKLQELEKLKQEIELKQIEQKRQELERLAAQLEKEKTIEKKPELKQKKIQPVKIASINPANKNIKTTASSNSADQNIKIAARDGHYIKYSNGIIYDKKTGLEWFAGPDSYIGRHAAEAWIKDLKLDGGNWRIPKKKELKTIVQKGAIPRIKISVRYVWYKESVLNFFVLNDGSTKDNRDFVSTACSNSCQRALGVRKISKLKKALTEKALLKLADTKNKDKNWNILKSDGQYVKYENGILYNKKTGLEWFAGTDSYIGRHAAQAWVKDLKLDGGNWRMPKKRELESNFKKEERPRFLKTKGKNSPKYIWYEESVLSFYSLSEASIQENGTISSACINLCQRGFAVRKISNLKKTWTEKALLKLANTKKRDKGWNILKRDGQYIKYENGVIYDEKTGLEWFAGPDKGQIIHKMKAWAQALNVSGSEWRLPSTKEIKTLYKKGAGSRNMTPLFKTNGWELLTSAEWPYGHYMFNFQNTMVKEKSYLSEGINNFRVFAVRSRK
jgi:hypothetical protein